jgi:hypothetical protein
MLPTGPLFKWFGSKWMNARYCPKPSHSTVIEPFAGGAGYSLRYADRSVILAEVNDHVYDLWKWLIEDATAQDVADIPLDLEVGYDITSLPLSYGQKLLLKNWQRTNNVGDCWTVSPWGNKPGQWTANTRKRVAKDISCVSHWQVSRDGFTLLESDLSDRQDITWFIDPVYQYNYTYRLKTPFPYDRLASAVSKLKGEVIVCEAVCPKTGATPTYLPFTYFRSSVTSRRAQGNHTHSKELLYYRPNT